MNENEHNMNPYQPYPHYYPQATPAYYPTYQTSQPQRQQDQATQGLLPMEQSYIENILRLNRGKNITVHMTFSNNERTFAGIIEEAGRDHIIIKNPDSEERHLLLMVYLDYIVFNEEVNYEYPFGSNAAMFSNYPGR